MKSLVIILVCLLVGVQVFGERSESEYESMFEQWVQEHGKVYNEEEVVYRFRIFKQNVDFIEEFNSNSQEHSFTVGLNKFADLTNTEFLERYTGFRRALVHVFDEEHKYEYDSSQALPVSVDWRKKNAVTGVKDQGQCGSCWSFSTTGSIEGAWALNFSLVSLSEQNLMDCSRKYGNLGCNGGLMDSAFKYVIANNGIDTEASYPYKGSTTYSCNYNVANRGATIKSYKDVTSGSESALQNSVAYHGPVSVAIDASNNSFQLYKSGVYYEPKCSSSNLDHGVLAVGYGTGTSGDYWIVKNSWGTSWGEQGYIYMARNKNNNCGIATQASFPLV